MKSKKRIASLITASALMVSSLSVAAPYDVTNKTTGTVSDILTWSEDSGILLDVAEHSSNYLIEVNNKLYKTEEVVNAMQANPGKSIEEVASGLIPVEDPNQSELKVESISAINKTEIKVVFSDDTAANFTVAPLSNGANTVKFTHLGVEYTGVVNFVAKAATEKIEFNNYRQLTVTYNTVVDPVTATNPSNYYFEIVEGDATFGVAPTLQDSNQLSQIETAFTSALPAGNIGWWDPAFNHITQETVNGKTVVTINLPEDARFTNTLDDDNASSVGTVAGATQDDERTLNVNLAGGGQKALVKNTNVVVAVRNVRNSDGVRMIDTHTESVKILDDVNPKVVGKTRTRGTVDTAFTNSVELYDDGSDVLSLEFDESVFDAHDLNTGTQNRNVQVYVNGRLAASTADADLAGILDFEMSTDGTYQGSKVATFNAAAAVAAAGGGETFVDGDIHKIRILGVTDLAGNIQVPTEIEFNVEVKDTPVPGTPPTQTTKPEVLGVKQVADNMFRVEWNMEDATGEFIIENADGEAGRLLKNIPLSTEEPVSGKFYSYVPVDAVDVDSTVDLPTAPEDDILAYDGQKELNRIVRVRNPWSVDTVANEYKIKGDNYVANNGGTFKIVKDTLAPEVVTPAVVEWDDASVAGKTLTLSVSDLMPAEWTQEYSNPVKALLYKYTAGTKVIDKNTVEAFGDTTDVTAAIEHLPIKVSYVDGNGATRSALLSNVDLIETTGTAGAISFDESTQELTLDLDGYISLLDSDDELVKGAIYKVEVPTGFFADPEKEDAGAVGVIAGQTDEAEFQAQVTNAGDIAPQVADDLSAVVADDTYTALLATENLEVLHVSQARTATDATPTIGKGYSSNRQVISYQIGEEPTAPGGVTEDAVPQTSKELITYDVDTNEITVEFTGAIKADTLKKAVNYTLNGKTLAGWGLSDSDITYKVETDAAGDITNQYAIFEVPVDSVVQDGDVQFIVEGVTNPAGGTMTRVLTQIGLLDNTRAVATKVVKQGDYQIVLTYDEPLQYRENSNEFTAAKNYVVKVNGQALPGAVLEARLVNGERKVTLQLGIDITATTGTITVETVKDDAGNINIIDMSNNKNPLNADKVYTVNR